MKKRLIYFFVAIILCLTAGYFFASLSDKKIPSIPYSPQSKPTATIYPPQNVQPTNPAENPDMSVKKTEPAPPAIDKKIEQQVPFIVQAPFANWSDNNFQNGCEEASMVMAMGWTAGEKTISPTEAQKRILEIIDFENKTLGYSTDTNAFDIERIFREYFKHEKVMAKENITLADIKAEIQKGNVVIVPAFGQALENPNFTQSGPVAHMLLIIGYDPATKQFITNDPGTKNGASYKYDESFLFDAIWEYPSGKSDPPMPTPGKMMKAMISVSK